MKKGFSLIEIVLIVALVAITFVGVMSLTSRVMQMEHVIKNDFIAQGLLREGMEIVEAIKYENVSSTIPVLPYYSDLTSGSPTTGTTRTFVLDYKKISTTNRSGIVDVSDYKAPQAKLRLDTNDYYQHQTGEVTPFSRVITTVYGTEGTKSYLDVKVTVYWESYGKGHQNSLSSRIYQP